MIHKHYCPNCSARMEFAGAHCGREDCKSAAYVIALKASGAASVMSYEDGRDPHAGPRLAEIERLSTVDSKKVRDFLSLGPGVRLFPSVDQTQTQALPKSECNSQKYPPCVGHSGPPEFREWHFIGRDVPPDLERKLPAGDPKKLVRVFFRYAPNGWIAETFGGFTKSEVFQSANEAMLWANRTFCPSQETRWGVWLTPKYPSAGMDQAKWLGNSSYHRGALSLEEAKRWHHDYSSQTDRLYDAQIRVYCNEHAPGNLYIEPTPDRMTAEEALCKSAAALPGMSLFGETVFHLAKAYDFKWKTDPTDAAKPEKLKAEKLSDWTRVNFRDIPGVGRVCDYVREVPERNLVFKISHSSIGGINGLFWIPSAKYEDGPFVWLGQDFKTIEEAKAFCDQKAKER